MVCNVVYVHLTAGAGPQARTQFDAALRAPLDVVDDESGEAPVAEWLTALMDEADEQTGDEAEEVG